VKLSVKKGDNLRNVFFVGVAASAGMLGKPVAAQTAPVSSEPSIAEDMAAITESDPAPPLALNVVAPLPTGFLCFETKARITIDHPPEDKIRAAFLRRYLANSLAQPSFRDVLVAYPLDGVRADSSVVSRSTERERMFSQEFALRLKEIIVNDQGPVDPLLEITATMGEIRAAFIPLSAMPASRACPPLGSVPPPAQPFLSQDDHKIRAAEARMRALNQAAQGRMQPRK